MTGYSKKDAAQDTDAPIRDVSRAWHDARDHAEESGEISRGSGPGQQHSEAELHSALAGLKHTDLLLDKEWRKIVPGPSFDVEHLLDNIESVRELQAYYYSEKSDLINRYCRCGKCQDEADRDYQKALATLEKIEGAARRVLG